MNTFQKNCERGQRLRFWRTLMQTGWIFKFTLSRADRINIATNIEQIDVITSVSICLHHRIKNQIWPESRNYRSRVPFQRAQGIRYSNRVRESKYFQMGLDVRYANCRKRNFRIVLDDEYILFFWCSENTYKAWDHRRPPLKKAGTQISRTLDKNSRQYILQWILNVALAHHHINCATFKVAGSII